MLILALSLVILLSACEPDQRRRKDEPKIKSVIPKEKRPKLFLAWIAGSALAVATIALGIKNSRRTHLD